MITSPMPSKIRLAHLKTGKKAFQLANHATRMLNEPLFGLPTHNNVAFTPNIITFYSRGLEISDPEPIVTGLRQYKETKTLIPDFLRIFRASQEPDWIAREIEAGYEDVRGVWLTAGQEEAIKRVIPQRVNVSVEPRPVYKNLHWHAHWTLGLEMEVVPAVIMQRRNDTNLQFYGFEELIRLCWSNLFANHSKRMALEPRFEIYDWRDITERYPSRP